MAEESRPVAIRIFRPFETEDEFLAQELDTLTKTTIVLLGTQPRPQGVILRFELLLASGEPLLRGEGRVIAHKEEAHAGLPGLTLRFTRLDPRSKALVDRAAALKKPGERPHDSLFPRPSQPPIEVASVPPLPRGRLSAPPVEVSEPPPPLVAEPRAIAEATPLLSLRTEPSLPPSDSVEIPIVEDEESIRAHAETRNVPLVAAKPSSPPPSVPTAPPPSVPTAPPPSLPTAPPARPSIPPSASMPPSASIPPTAPSPVRAATPAAPPSEPVVSLPPASKNALLDRLRDRAKNLSPEAVEAIFVRR